MNFLKAKKISKKHKLNFSRANMYLIFCKIWNAKKKTWFQFFANFEKLKNINFIFCKLKKLNSNFEYSKIEKSHPSYLDKWTRSEIIIPRFFRACFWTTHYKKQSDFLSAWNGRLQTRSSRRVWVSPSFIYHSIFRLISSF